MRISDWSSDVCSSDLEPVTQSAVDIQAFAWLSNDRIVVASRPGQIAEAAKIDAEGRTGWHYDARITPEYGLRPQMPASAFSISGYMPPVPITVAPRSAPSAGRRSSPTCDQVDRKSTRLNSSH